MKTKLYLLSYCLFFTQVLFSQIDFQRQAIIDYTHRANGVEKVIVADIDGDGDMDVLSASYNDNKIAWYENIDSLGSFSYFKLISGTAEGATSVFAADLDGDGDLDVLSTSASDHTVQWYENIDGNGLFGQGQVISDSAIGASAVFAADLDGDNDMDVIVGSAGNDKVVWFQNLNDTNLFGPEQILSSQAQNVSDVHAADIDGDGDMDVLSASPTGWSVQWYKNVDGAGTFDAGNYIETGSVDVNAITTGDVDDDGDLDVFTVNGGSVQWYRNTDGAGNFSFYNQIGNTNGANAVHVADLDGDDDLDVLSTGYVDDRVSWFENTDGAGSFGSKQTIRSVEGPKSLATADFDNDGDLDVVSGTRIPGQIVWSENEATAFDQTHPVTYQLEEPNRMAIGDINGDSIKDLVTITYFDNKILWFENDGNGTYGIPNIIYSGSEVEELLGLKLADLDGDEDLDIVFASHGYGEVGWLENTDGLGTFGPKVVVAFETDIEIAVIDVDTDGDLDIVYVPFEAQELLWLENLDGEANFIETPATLSDADFVSKLHHSDFDNDGDEDLFYTSINEIFSLENLGGQNGFASPVTISGALDVPLALNTRDLDNDGDLDLLSASGQDNKIAWYENTDGQGSYGPQQVISESITWATSVDAADFDGDGDMDIIAVANGESKLIWMEHIDGQGTFGAIQEIEDDLYGVRTVIAEDIDGDSDQDIMLLVSYPRNELVWYENRNAGGNEIFGHLRIDLEGNGCDQTDVTGASNLMVKAFEGMDTLSTFSLANGLYQLFPEEGVFTVTAIAPEYYELAPATQMVEFSGVGALDTLDFCLEPIAVINDLNITLLPTSEARPGFDASYQLVYRNVGTTQLSGSLTMEYDETKLSWLSASEAVSEQTNNSLSFEYLDLNPFESRTIDLDFNVLPPPIVNIDDSLSFVCTINPTVEDQTPEDNVFELEQLVIGSYDPNDITVLEGASISPEQAEDFLHYVIRFQNTGTASAINVRVENELDDNLNWSSIQLLSMSHEGRVEIADGKQVAFIFDGINLPDSTNNEPESHGFIAYKIKPRAGIQVGESISNRADIYFDFNEAVLTNTVVTTVEDPTSVFEIPVSFFNLFPNPAGATLSVQSDIPIQKVEIFNQVGQIQIVSYRSVLDVSDLSIGFYLCKVTGQNGQIGIRKIIKR